MRWWLLLLIPAVSAQGLSAELEDSTFEYDVETWKSETPQDASSVGPWHASLGHALTLSFSAPGGEAWTYEATLTDGRTTLPATITQGTLITAQFDIDGQRALPGEAAVPPLVPGEWRYRLAASQPAAAGGNPIGFITGTITTDALQFDGVVGPDGFLPGMSVPEHLLPNIREVGAGPTTWMPTETHPSLAMQLSGTPGANITLRGWTAAGPALTEPLPGLPVNPLTLTDPATQWTRLDMPVLQLDQTGRIQFAVPSEVGNRLVVMSGTSEFGGGATWVMGFGGEPYHVESVIIEPGGEGLTQVAINGPWPTIQGAVMAPRPMPLHAISMDGLVVTAEGSRELAAGLALPTEEDHWAGGVDGRATRASGVHGYHILGWILDANGTYVGHTVASRGVEPSIQLESSGVQVTLQHIRQGSGRVDHAHTVKATITATLDGKELGTRTLTVPEGGRISHTFATNVSPGAHDVDLIVDTGDLRFEGGFVGAVDEDASRNTPIPLPVLAILAALGLRKREIEHPSGPRL